MLFVRGHVAAAALCAQPCCYCGVQSRPPTETLLPVHLRTSLHELAVLCGGKNKKSLNSKHLLWWKKLAHKLSAVGINHKLIQRKKKVQVLRLRLRWRRSGCRSSCLQ